MAQVCIQQKASIGQILWQRCSDSQVVGNRIHLQRFISKNGAKVCTPAPGKLTGKDLWISARSSLGFFSGPFWPTDSVTGKIKCRVAAPDFQPTLKCYRWNQVVILATWFATTLQRYRQNQVVILTTWFLRSGSDVLQIKPELSKWELRWLCHGCNQVIILITWFWYGYDQVPKVGTWFGRSCKSSYGKRNLISDNRPNSHFEDLGVSN